MEYLSHIYWKYFRHFYVDNLILLRFTRIPIVQIDLLTRLLDLFSAIYASWIFNGKPITPSPFPILYIRQYSKKLVASKRKRKKEETEEEGERNTARNCAAIFLTALFVLTSIVMQRISDTCNSVNSREKWIFSKDWCWKE